MGDPEKALLHVEEVSKRFLIKTSTFEKEHVHALNDVSITILPGRTLSLVGESGCGKTTLGKAVLGLHTPDSGQIHFQDREISGLVPRQRKSVQKEMSMIFQDPYASLNPRKKVRSIVEKPLKVFTGLDKMGRTEEIEKTCNQVGLDVSYLNRYPHQFSGGQRQRIAIARAIITHPSLVIADEPVSALDVSIQAQILNLMMELKESLSLSYLFITHDISVVRHISDEVGVMYLGQIVEYGPRGRIFSSPVHPYTRMLFSAVPEMDKPFSDESVLTGGEIPSPTRLPPGCFFEPRCPYKIDECKKVRPEPVYLAENHWSRCIRAKEIA